MPEQFLAEDKIMNSRLRLILLFIGLATVVGLLILIYPKALSLYYQIKGGQVIDAALESTGNLPDVGISCEALPQERTDLQVKVEDSVDLLKLALDYNSNNAQASLYLGRAFCLLNDPNTASEYYQEYTELRPKNPLGYLELGFAYEAECLRIQSAVDVDINYVKGWRQCGDQELQDNIITAWEAGGVTPQNLFANGNQAENKKRYGRALLWYGRANVMKPDWADPFFRSGLVFSDLGDWNNAARLLELALMQESDDRDAWYQLGLAYEELKEWNQALEAYEEALKYPGEVGASNVYFRIGRIKEYSLSQRDYAGAMEAFDEAIALDDYTAAPWQKASTFHERGVILFRQGRLIEAIDQYQTAISLLPSNYLSRVGLATALWKNGQNEEAIDAADSAIQLDPLDKRAYNILGNIYLDIGEFGKAEEMYRKVLELDPFDPNATNGINVIKGEGP